jgi:hypothetical protein
MRITTGSSILVVALASMLVLLGQGAKDRGPKTSAGSCDCGPDWCLRDPRYAAKLAAKKKDMQNNGFPAELIALLDRDGACVAAVEQGPDTFFIKRAKASGFETLEWNTEREGYAKSDILDGKLDVYYMFNTNHAFSCCGQPKYYERPDWDAAKDLNLGLALVCRKAGNTVQCKPGA